jgi:hypothetical protein
MAKFKVPEGHSVHSTVKKTDADGRVFGVTVQHKGGDILDLDEAVAANAVAHGNLEPVHALTAKEQKAEDKAEAKQLEAEAEFQAEFDEAQDSTSKKKKK